MLTNSQRFEELDSFRGLAALAVVLYHFTLRYEHVYHHNEIPFFSLPYGDYGVQFFFMISGFVIFMTLEKCTSSRDFLVSRFCRLFPAYWVAVLITFSVGYFAPLPNQELTMTQLLVNLSMLQAFFYIPSVDGVYWSLAFELSFYFVMLMIFLSRQLHAMEYLIIVWLSAMLANFLLPYTGFEIPWRLQLLGVLKYTNAFMAGIVFYQIYHHGFSVLRVATLIACLVLELICVSITSFIFFTAFFALFLLAIRGQLTLLKHPALLYMGAISYTLYLTHQMLGFKVIHLLEAQGMAPDLAILIAVICSILLASVLTRYVERPGGRFFKKLLQNPIKPATAR